MGESVGGDGSLQLLDHSGLQQFGDRRPEVPGRFADRLAQDRQVQAATDGDQVGQSAGGDPEAIDLADHHLPHPVGHHVTVDGRELADQKGVSVGPHGDDLGAVLQLLAHAPCGEDLPHVVDPDATKLESDHGLDPAQVGQHRGQQFTDLVSGVPERPDHQQSIDGRMADQVPQEGECLATGPLEVLEHEHDRGQPTGRPQEASHGVEEPDGVGLRPEPWHRYRPSHRVFHPRDERLEMTEFPRSIGEDVFGDLGHQCIQRHDPRLVGKGQLAVTEPAEDKGALPVPSGSHLRRQTGLAGSGLTPDEHHRAASVGNSSPGGVQRLTLRESTDERVRRPGRQGRGEDPLRGT